MMSEADEQHHAFARLLMIEKICTTADEVGSYPISEKVLEVMAKVPRHRFCTRRADAQCLLQSSTADIDYGQTISPLADRAASRLKELGCRNVHLKLGDGGLA